MNFIKNNKKALLSILILALFVLIGEQALANVPKKVYLYINGLEKKEISTSENTVKDFLIKEGYNIQDIKIKNNINDKIKNNYKIELNTKKYIIFTNQGKTLKTSTFTNTVKDFIKEQKISINKSDLLSVSLDKKIKNGMKLKYDKVKNVSVKENKVIKYTTKTIYSSDLPVNTQKTKIKGKNGLQTISIDKTYVNGKLVSKKIKSKNIVKNPVQEVIIIGTKSIADSDLIYSLADLQFNGIIYWGNYKFTYYSQQVLPGGGLYIPGRHVNAEGFVADEDGYIVVANDAPIGTIIETPFGHKAKVYDRGTVGNHIDVYTE